MMDVHASVASPASSIAEASDYLDFGETLGSQSIDNQESTSKLRRRLAFGARLSFCLFLLLTSIYCLLAYIPFTYHWIVNGELIGWLPVFVKYHPCFYLAAIGLVVPTIARDVHRPRTRRLALGFIVVQLSVAVWMVFEPLLPALANDESSLRWSLIALSPLLWLAAIDFAGSGRTQVWAAGTTPIARMTLPRMLWAGQFLSISYFVIFMVRFGAARAGEFNRREALVIAVWSIVSNLLLAAVVFIILRLVREISERYSTPQRARFILFGALVAIAGTVLIRQLILAALSFDDYLATVYAVAVSLVVVLFFGGYISRFSRSDRNERVAPKSAGLFARLTQSASAKKYFLLGFVGIAAYALPVSVARMDWDFLMQKLSVFVVWAATFAICIATAKAPSQSPKRRPLFALLLVAVCSASVLALLGWSRTGLPRLLRDERLDVNSTLEHYAAYDPSFRVTHSMMMAVLDFSLSRMLRNSSLPSTFTSDRQPGVVEPDEDAGFYELLKKNTNLMASVKVDPVDIRLVSDLKRTSGRKPNIFIFVVDSLRQDYLSPYNRNVTFTPHIDSFGRESVVMRNAFTPYGGTVLAEPSIWTGTLQIHKQYVEPFYPMNSLQKLIDVEDYDQYMTVDPVVKIIAQQTPRIVELDKNLPDWKKLSLAQTLRELRARMEARADKSRPVFVYTQAQQIHIHVLNAQRRDGPPFREYPGFDSYVATQIEDMDAGFGEFIDYLKASGEYENSVIVITSDHGDSLGEFGRWGHATWIYPEVLRIPVIIHLPSYYRDRYYWDPETIAFSSDVTPSLYYMLNHRPMIQNEAFGKPLFTLTPEEQADYKTRSYMVASSYGPSYGILSENGRMLFISDAANSKDYYYDLKEDPKGMRNLVTSEIRMANEKQIRRKIDAINSLYRFYPDQAGK